MTKNRALPLANEREHLPSPLPRGSGRPPKLPSLKKRKRCNLLLDDRERLVFDELTRRLTAYERRAISGSELLRRLIVPALAQVAESFNLDFPEVHDNLLAELPGGLIIAPALLLETEPEE